MDFITTPKQPLDKFQQIKVFIKSSYTSFDNPNMNKSTISEEVIKITDFKAFSERLNESCDGETTHKVVLAYDVFDNEPYSVRWLEGS